MPCAVHGPQHLPLYRPPLAKQLPLDRVKQNFDLWYGGVPRLAIERPAMEVDATLDAEAATNAICTTSIDQVCALVVQVHAHGSVISPDLHLPC